LKDDELLGVAVMGVIRQRHLAEEAVHVPGVEGLAAHRAAADHIDDIACLIGAGDVRHHDAGGIALERLHILAVAAFVHADDGVHVVKLRGADLVLQIEPVVRHMLIAKPHGTGSGQPGELDDAWIAEVELQDGAVLTGAEFAEDTGGAELHNDE
jgi:hypothetical protein